MRLPLRAAWIALAFVVALGASAQASEGQRWALVVGVDRYDSQQITPLRFAGADARAMAKTLREVAGFPEDHVILMTSASPEQDRPSSGNLLRRLVGLRSVVKPEDTFVFYFSGHGVEQDGESFLLTADAALDSSVLMRKTCVSVSEMEETLKEMSPARVLQFVDACRNDPRAGKGDADNPLSEGFSKDLSMLAARGSREPEAAATIYACQLGQRSYEGYQGHGYFTYFLVRGLGGEAAGSDGAVTLPSLVNYLEARVPEAVQLNLGGREQTPWADTRGSGAMGWVLVKFEPGTKVVIELEPAEGGSAAPQPEAEPDRARGFLGIEPSEVTDPVQGIRIDVMYARKAAHRAGLYMGDVITQVGGARVRTRDQLRAALARYGAGDKVELEVHKGGELKSFIVKLSDKPYDDGWDPESPGGW